MTYERKIGRILRDWLREVQEPELAEGKLFLGQWICFRDKNGRGFAQPDAFIVFPWGIWLFECKLTQSDGAEAQAMKLYKPLLEFIYGKPVVACQIFKNMRYRVEKMIEQPEDLIKQKGYWQWHNLG